MEGRVQTAMPNLSFLHVIKKALPQTPPSCDVTSATLLPITALVVEEGETQTSSSRISEPWVVFFIHSERGRGNPPGFSKEKLGNV